MYHEFRKQRRMMQPKDDHYWMGMALREAKKAEARGEVPIGALIVRDNVVLGRGYNLRETSHDPTSHAEMLAIRKASKKAGNWRLLGASLYVTLEPCAMCMGAAILARLERIIFGCHDPKGGAAGSLFDLSNDHRLNHRIELTAGIRQDECSELLSSFFEELRLRKKSLPKQTDP